MSRHWYGAAALFAAVIAGQAVLSDAAVVSFPQGGLMINNQNVAAYNYTNNPFQCTTPTVHLNVNATHVWMLITTYSQSSSDARAGTTPNGRAQWAWSTFLQSVATPPAQLWDPVSNDPTIATMSNSATGGAANQPSKDAFRWDGSCAVGNNNVGSNIASAYQTVGTITVAPTLPSGTSPLRTPDLAPYTFQAAGCNCGAYAILNTSVVVDLVLNASVTNTNTYPCSTGPDNDRNSDVFYTVSGNPFNGLAPAVMSGQVGVTQASKTNGWAMRQSTCGSSWRDSLSGAGCSTAGTGAAAYSYYTGVATVPGGTCSLKTEALMVMPVEQFIVRLADAGVLVRKTAGSVLSYTWKEYVVEYASTKGTDMVSGVDAYQTRVTPSAFQISLYPAGAVVQSLAVGAMAPPMMMHTTATGSAGAVSWAQRSSVDGNVLQMTWQYDSYVQQSPDASPTTGPDTLFMTSIMGSSTSPTSSSLAPGDLSLGPQLVIAPTSSTNSIYADAYQWTCNTWSAASADQTQPASMASTVMVQTNGAITSGYTCANDNCQPIALSSLPSDMLTGLTAAAVKAGSYWVQYHVTVACTITAQWTVGTPWNVSQPFNLPSTTIKMGYRLADALNTEITDDVAPPFSEIVQVGYSSPGVVSQNVSFQVQTHLVQLSKTDIQTADTLSDLIYATEKNPIPSVIQYSGAMALKVQIVDTAGNVDATNAIRNEWQLMPALMVMVVHDINHPDYTPISQDYVQLSSGNKLPPSWCGLNQGAANVNTATGANSGGPLMGVWAVVDSRSDPTNSDNTGTFLAGWQTDGSSSLGYTVTKLGPQYNSISDALSPDLQNELGYLLNNNNFSDIESLQSDITTGGTIVNFVATANDASGGFAFPLRNRFIVNGKASGYQLSFCTITQAVPYLPQASGSCVDAVNAQCNANYPLYVTANAAMADTMAYAGNVYPPITYVNPTTSVKYYMPSLPASTGGVVCHDGGAIFSGSTKYPGIQASVPTVAGATTVYQSSTSDICKAFILPAKTQQLTNEGNSNQGGRRLLANKRPQHNLYPTTATTFSTAFTVKAPAAAHGGPLPSTPRTTTAKVSIQPYASPVANPAPQNASSPPTEAPAPSPSSEETPMPVPAPLPVTAPGAQQIGRNAPLPIGPNTTLLTPSDEAQLDDIQNKVKIFTALNPWVGGIAIGASIILAILGIVFGIIFCARRNSNSFGPPRTVAGTTPGEAAAKPGTDAFRGSSYRPFGSGPARMQWRAY